MAETKRLSDDDLKDWGEAAKALASAQSAMAAANGRVQELLVRFRVAYGLAPGEVPDIGTGEIATRAAPPGRRAPTVPQHEEPAPPPPPE